jgi:hypothetical protein
MAEEQTVPGLENISAVRPLRYIHPHYRAFLVVPEYSGDLPCKILKTVAQGGIKLIPHIVTKDINLPVPHGQKIPLLLKEHFGLPPRVGNGISFQNKSVE